MCILFYFILYLFIYLFIRNTVVLGTLKDLRAYKLCLWWALWGLRAWDTNAETGRENTCQPRPRCAVAYRSQWWTPSMEVIFIQLSFTFFYLLYLCYRAPFPRDAYAAIVASASRLLKSLVMMDRSFSLPSYFFFSSTQLVIFTYTLHRAIRSAVMEGTKIKLILHPLVEDLRGMKVEMIGNLDELLTRLEHGGALSHHFKVLSSPTKHIYSHPHNIYSHFILIEESSVCTSQDGDDSEGLRRSIRVGGAGDSKGTLDSRRRGERRHTLLVECGCALLSLNLLHAPRLCCGYEWIVARGVHSHSDWTPLSSLNRKVQDWR